MEFEENFSLWLVFWCESVGCGRRELVTVKGDTEHLSNQKFYKMSYKIVAL